MKSCLILFMLLFITIQSLNAQLIDWANSIGGPNDDKVSEYSEIDPMGNIFIAGTFMDSINFGAINIKSKRQSTKDFFIAKMNSSGEYVWAINGGGKKGDSEMHVMKTDNEGNIIVLIISWANPEIEINGITLQNDYGYNGFYIYLLKLSNDGELIWGGKSPSEFVVFNYFFPSPKIVFDKNNNIYILSSIVHGEHSEILKLNPNGDLIFRHKYYPETSGRAWTTSGCIDNNDNLYVSYYFNLSMEIGNNKYEGKDNVLITCFNPEGSLKWSKNIGSVGIEYVYGMVIIDNKLNVVGKYAEGIEPIEVDFGGKLIKRLDNYTGFYAKYELNGTLDDIFNIPVNFMGGINNLAKLYQDGEKTLLYFNTKLYSINQSKLFKNELSEISSFSLSSCGNQIVSGEYTISKTFSNGNPLISVGGIDIFVAKLKRENPYPLPKPTLNYPANNSNAHNLISMLGWFGVGCASSYQIQISKDENFNQIVFDKDNISNYSIYSDSLEYLTKYFWKVRAFSSDTLSEWSETWNFTTVKPEPDLVSLIYPANNSVNIEKKLTLTWDLTPRASKFFLQLSKDIDFAEKVVSNANIVENKFQVELEFETQYYWKVAAANSFGASDWSEIWTFKTLPDKPETPQLVTPNNNSVNEPINTRFTWNNVGANIVYNIIISQDTDFVFKDYDLNISEIQWKGMLEKNTEYFWKVKAVNSFISSDWSEVWSFKTGTETSIQTQDILTNFTVFPNPITDMLQINVGETNLPVSLKICDLIGNVVFVQELNNLNNSIDVSNLCSGVYWVSINDNSRKIIILH